MAGALLQPTTLFSSRAVRHDTRGLMLLGPPSRTTRVRPQAVLTSRGTYVQRLTQADRIGFHWNDFHAATVFCKSVLSRRRTITRKRVVTSMFDRFTEKAIKVIMLSQDESRWLRHDFVGTEQILLGLIAEGTGIGAKALKSLGITMKAARIEVEKIVGRGTGNVSVEIPFTVRAKRVLELSMEEGCFISVLCSWLHSDILLNIFCFCALLTRSIICPSHFQFNTCSGFRNLLKMKDMYENDLINNTCSCNVPSYIMCSVILLVEDQ